MKKKSLKEAIEEQLQKQEKYGVQILEAKKFKLLSKMVIKKLILCISMMLAFSLATDAQNVTRQGNTFTQVSNKKSAGKETKTTYTYKDSKGVEHPVYLSSTGKAFIYYINKKGEQKRRYMPEIGKQINPEAYKDKK